jgi:hypothetical protein
MEGQNHLIFHPWILWWHESFFPKQVLQYDNINIIVFCGPQHSYTNMIVSQPHPTQWPRNDIQTSSPSNLHKFILMLLVRLNNRILLAYELEDVSLHAFLIRKLECGDS